jgi:uncharacterized membrane protein
MPETKQGTVIPKFDPKDVEYNKMIAAIAYISILCLIPLILKKDSRFAYEHGKQGFILFITELIVWALGMLPVIGWFIIGPIGTVLCVIAAVVAILKAVNGEFWEIPVVGQYRDKVKI